MFKKFLPILFLFTGFQVNAGVIDSVDVTIGGNTYTSFVDDVSGYTWLDLDNFWGVADTYNSVVNELAGSSFSLATQAQAGSLFSSIGTVASGTEFASVAEVVGGNYIGNGSVGADRELIWGVLASDTSDGLADWAFDLAPLDGTMRFGSNRIGSLTTLSAYNVRYMDLGAWVVSTTLVAQVPEPSIIALFGLGLVGIGFARRRQS